MPRLYEPVSGSRVTQTPAVMKGGGSYPGVEIRCRNRSTPPSSFGACKTISLTGAALRSTLQKKAGRSTSAWQVTLSQKRHSRCLPIVMIHNRRLGYLQNHLHLGQDDGNMTMVLAPG